MRNVLMLVSLVLLIGSLTFSAAALQLDAIQMTAGGQTAALQGDEQPPVPPDDGDTADGLLAGVRELLDQVLALLTNSQQTDNAAAEPYPAEETPEEAPPADTSAEEVEETPPVEATDDAETPEQIDEAEPVEETNEAEGTTDEETTGEEVVLDTRQKADALKEQAETVIAELLARTSVPPDESEPVEDEPADAEEAEPADAEDAAAQSAGADASESDVEATAESLLAQAQELLAQVTGEAEPVEDQAIIQEWMPSMPDCDAPAAPMVNWSMCDKSGIELDGANLEGAILVETDFSDALIINTDMSGANLKMADFSGATLDNVLLRDSNLAWVDFTDSLIYFVDLSYADAASGMFDGAELYVTTALGTKLAGADFSNTILYFNDFSLADLRGADFADSLLGISFFRGSNLEGANLSDITLVLLDMTGANVQKVDFSGSTLQGIWFKSAIGEPADSTADLTASEYVCPDGTYSAGPTTTDAASLCTWDTPPSIAPAPPDIADCNAAPAPGVNWSGCDKSALSDDGLDLRNANLQGTIFSGNTMYMWDLSGADMSGAQLDGGSTTLSALRGANLNGATLDGREILYSDLSSADLQLASLAGAFVFFSTARDANLNEAVLDGAFVNMVDLSYADLNGASAVGILQGLTRLRAADLSGINLTDAAQDMIDASRAVIEQIDLSNNLLTDGIWFKDANGEPTSSVDLTLQETLICPAGDAVFGPLTTDAASLCSWNECAELIKDGDFEQQSDVWDLPATEYTAEFSQDQAHSPDWSVRTGIVDPMDNTFSFSSVRQTVTLPAGMSNAVLTFYLYPQTDEPKNFLIPNSMEEALSIKGATSSMGPHGSHIGDAQWVIIFDDMGHELMRPVSMRSNSQTWEYYEVDLTPLVDPMMDRDIMIYFGTFNNGWEGVTAMYVDDVSLSNCNAVPAPPLPDLPELVCADTIVNGGFETQDNSWLLPITPMPADYSTAQFNSGAWSMRTGIVDPAENVNSFSSALQRVTIPADATSADLSFYLFQESSEATNLLIPESIETVLTPTAMKMRYGDAQWVLILNQHLQELERLVSTRSNEQSWRQYEFDLSAYAGRTVLLYFGTFNNGWDGRTAMYVDDVVLDVCSPQVD